MSREKINPDTGEVTDDLSHATLDALGREVPDPTPMAPPVGWFKQPSMVDHVRAMIRHEMSRQAEASGHESFEEADDFDIDDGDDPQSPYEAEFEPASELLARQQQASAPPPSSDAPSTPQNTASVPPSDGPATPLPKTSGT